MSVGRVADRHEWHDWIEDGDRFRITRRRENAGDDEPTSSEQGPSIDKCSQIGLAYGSLEEAAVPVETLSPVASALPMNRSLREP